MGAAACSDYVRPADQHAQRHPRCPWWMGFPWDARPPQCLQRRGAWPWSKRVQHSSLDCLLTAAVGPHWIVWLSLLEPSLTGPRGRTSTRTCAHKNAHARTRTRTRTRTPHTHAHRASQSLCATWWMTRSRYAGTHAGRKEAAGRERPSAATAWHAVRVELGPGYHFPSFNHSS